MEFSEKLLILRKKLGLTQGEMGDRLGLSLNYINSLENSNKRPSDAVVKHLDLLWDAQLAGLLEAGFVQPAPEAKHRAEVMAKGRKLPIIGWAHAGDANAYEEIPEDWQETMATDCPKERAFGLKLEGDSMEPKFSDGDVLIVMPDEKAYSGCFAVVKFVNDGVLFRRLEMNGPRVRLMPLNERYLASDHAFEEFAWIYPVWGRFTQLWKR